MTDEVNEVIYYCGNCNEVFMSEDNKHLNCPVCTSPLMNSGIKNTSWVAYTDDGRKKTKEYLCNQFKTQKDAIYSQIQNGIGKSMEDDNTKPDDNTKSGRRCHRDCIIEFCIVNGMLFVCSDRIIIEKKGLFGKTKVEEILYSDMEDVSYKDNHHSEILLDSFTIEYRKNEKKRTLIEPIPKPDIVNGKRGVYKIGQKIGKEIYIAPESVMIREYVALCEKSELYLEMLKDDEQYDMLCKLFRILPDVYNNWASTVMHAPLVTSKPVLSPVGAAVVGTAIGGVAVGVTAGVMANENYQRKEQMHRETMMKQVNNEVAQHMLYNKVCYYYDRILRIISNNPQAKNDWDNTVRRVSDEANGVSGSSVQRI